MKQLLIENELSANLFLKHLVILADFGGEMLQRASREFSMLFPAGKLSYYWMGSPSLTPLRLYQTKLSATKAFTLTVGSCP